MRNLVQEYPDRQFVLIMGADNLSILPKWKEYDYLIENYNILVYPRKGINIDIPENLKNIKRVDAPLMEISSTFIRQSIRENKDIRFFMPGNVWKMKDHYL
jgi:nicotinate-nucleotide adenylyltransferase